MTAAVSCWPFWTSSWPPRAPHLTSMLFMRDGQLDHCSFPPHCFTWTPFLLNFSFVFLSHACPQFLILVAIFQSHVSFFFNMICVHLECENVLLASLQLLQLGFLSVRPCKRSCLQVPNMEGVHNRDTNNSVYHTHQNLHRVSHLLSVLLSDSCRLWPNISNRSDRDNPKAYQTCYN